MCELQLTQNLAHFAQPLEVQMLKSFYLQREAPDLLTRFDLLTGAVSAISRTLALLRSAGTNLINYLLKVKVRTE